MKERDDLVRRLERELATECSIERLACLGTFAAMEGRDAWFTKPSDFQHADVHADYAAALRYMDLRGLIVRHPDHPDWILVKTEKAA